MIEVRVQQFRSKLKHYLDMAKTGQTVQLIPKTGPVLVLISQEEYLKLKGDP